MLCSFCHTVAILYSYPQIYTVHQLWHGYQFWKRHVAPPLLLCYVCLPKAFMPR